MLKSAIGLEAEFFLLDHEGQPVIPSKYGFETDDFPLIAEVRADPGKTRAEAIANFYKSFYQVQHKAKQNKLTVDIAVGHRTITPQLHNECIRLVGSKSVSMAKNIYPEVDIMNLSDAVVEDGQILHYKVSCGLHIHFSAQDFVESKTNIDETTYTAVQIPLAIEKITANLDLYRRDRQASREVKVTASADLITKPVVSHIVKLFDDNVFNRFKPEVPLKYRNPGFYERKAHGFEYRSLPFNKAIFEAVPEIVDYAFAALEDLAL